MSEVEIGRIEMRQRNGHKSWIAVARRESGEVDIHMSRSSEGEVLARLPRETAAELAELLRKATS